MHFDTREKFYEFVGTNYTKYHIQVWNAAETRWISVKDPKSSYHPYNAYRIVEGRNVQKIRIVCSSMGFDEGLNCYINVDKSLSQIKKIAKGLFGLNGTKGVWNHYSDTYTFVPRTVNVDKSLKIIFEK